MRPTGPDKTYKEWQALGFQVRKGSRNTGRWHPSGEATFSHTQVKPITDDNPRDYYDNGPDAAFDYGIYPWD